MNLVLGRINSVSKMIICNLSGEFTFKELQCTLPLMIVSITFYSKKCIAKLIDIKKPKLIHIEIKPIVSGMAS